MNNDKYAKYSNGRVVYGSNGAYTKGGESSEKKGCLSMIILAVSIPTSLIASMIMLMN
jgi:hypothetical protein